MAGRIQQGLQTLRSSLSPPMKERLVFLHVPKCGGNSVRRALIRAYATPLVGARHHHFDLVARRSIRAARLCGMPSDVYRDHLLRYHMCNRRLRLATGHFRWPEGLREQFPGTALLTMLREPVSCFLSTYFFRSEDRFRDDRLTDDLPTFLESDSARHVGASYVRMLTPAASAADATSSSALERAMGNLARVDVVGVLEDLPGFVDSFARRFGTRLAIPHLNAGRLRPRREREEVTAEVRARIAELVAPNRALYDFARRELVGRERRFEGGTPRGPGDAHGEGGAGEGDDSEP